MAQKANSLSHTKWLCEYHTMQETKRSLSFMMILSAFMAFASLSTDIYLPAMPAMQDDPRWCSGHDDHELPRWLCHCPARLGTDQRSYWSSHSARDRCAALFYRIGRLRTGTLDGGRYWIPCGAGRRRMCRSDAQPRDGA